MVHKIFDHVLNYVYFVINLLISLKLLLFFFPSPEVFSPHNMLTINLSSYVLIIS